MSRQLTFCLDLPPALTRDDYLCAPANKAAMDMLKSPEQWPGKMLLLIGDEGAGKTHLAHIWAQENRAGLYEASALLRGNIDAGVPAGGALAVEVMPPEFDGSKSEQAMFHLWNLCRERDCLLLLTARHAPRHWNITLPDLRSRLEAMTQVKLMAPDERLLAAVLVKLFADRQLGAPAPLIDWLVLHLDRDLGLARRVVAAMDQRAMAEKRPIGRKLAAEVLGGLTDTRP